MRKIHSIVNKTFALLVLLTMISCTTSDSGELKFEYEGNPLVRHMFTADPSARVFGDRLYVYTSHDEDDADENDHFFMINWHVFSTEDMHHWTDHGQIFSLDDITWADKQAWAPDCVERNGKYYFYYPVEQTMIGVAVSNSPTGPFTDPVGAPLINNEGAIDSVGREPIDPGILIDDDGQAYMYLGCRDPRVVKLKENMIELDGGLQPFVINGIEGHTEHNDGYYGEGPWMFKRNGIYYLMYANGWEPQSTLIYAMGTDPMGPFDYMGPVMSAVGAGTSHGSVVEYKGKWYLFYHNNSLSEAGKRRSVCFDEITFAEDGTINFLTYKLPE